tara:strand:+ start:182 stop:394 length:213 start_codon:yes stop_codon:yes gene_type:complete
MLKNVVAESVIEITCLGLQIGYCSETRSCPPYIFEILVSLGYEIKFELLRRYTIQLVVIIEKIELKKIKR